jgi:hypothetical protein
LRPPACRSAHAGYDPGGPAQDRRPPEQSGSAMSLFKMRMIGQQSDYFFVYPFWLKWHDLISTHEAKKKAERRTGIAESPTR